MTEIGTETDTETESDKERQTETKTDRQRDSLLITKERTTILPIAHVKRSTRYPPTDWKNNELHASSKLATLERDRRTKNALLKRLAHRRQKTCQGKRYRSRSHPNLPRLRKKKKKIYNHILTKEAPDSAL